ncbi:MAG: hypothetical protein E7317_02975 [Clostridiales bacterium]|nr:hypothetical protein [Clostridiales bacterium]
MRIKWNADRGRAVENSLEDMFDQLEALEGRLAQARAALDEANPAGDDKRLNAIARRFEAGAGRLTNVKRDTDDMRRATQRMIALFDGAENEVVRMLNELTAGSGAQADGAMGHMPADGRRTRNEPAAQPPFRIPRARIAPVTRLMPFGPVMDWLIELINRL